MISSGCGDSAAGRESSEPRPLQTDARLRAEVGGAQVTAERGGPGPGCGTGLRRLRPPPLRGWPPVQGRPPLAESKLRAPRSPRRLQRGPRQMRGPGCGGPDPVRRRRGLAATRRRGPGRSRHCGDRPRAPGGPALAAAAGLRHLGRRPHPLPSPVLPAPERAECGARRAPRRSWAPRAQVFPVQCVCSEGVFLLQTDLEIWPQPGGSSVQLQPYNRMGILLSAEKGQRGKEGGAVPFPGESQGFSGWETSVLFRSRRLLISFWTVLQKPAFFLDLGSRKVTAFLPWWGGGSPKLC